MSYEQKIRYFFSMSNIYFKMAMDAEKDGDIKKAIGYYSTSWAFSNLVESSSGKYDCDYKLKELGIDDKDLIECHEAGREISDQCIKSSEAFILSRGMENYLEDKLPKDIFD